MWTVLLCLLSIITLHGQVNRTTSIRGDEIMITFQRTQGYMKVVTGAPYSADLIDEHSRTLADGDVIQDPPGSQHNVRDGQGRMRVEAPLVLPNGDPKQWQPRLTQISDPIAGFLYVFDDQHKVAHRLKFNQPLHPNPPRKFSVPESNIDVPASEGRPERKVENLGEKLIEGIPVKGERTTMTWSPGTRENKYPLVHIQETWYCDELQEVVYQKIADPRSGEIIHRLAKIDRSEPDPALFQAPPDYQVTDEEGAFTITLRRPKP